MFNKMILGLSVFLFVSVAEAKNVWPAKAVKLECAPATKVYPFEQFTVTLDEKLSVFKAKFSKAAGSIYEDIELRSGRNSDYIDVEEISVEQDEEEVLSLEAKLYGDFYDWGAARIEIGQDDDGYAAFVYFFSDGPTIRSFYRCELK